MARLVPTLPPQGAFGAGGHAELALLQTCAQRCGLNSDSAGKLVGRVARARMEPASAIIAAVARDDRPAAGLGAPLVRGGVTEAVFAAYILDWHSDLGLARKADDLLFAVFAGSHVHHSPM